MRARILSALLGLVLCGSGVAIAQSGFIDTFDGAPAAPAPYPTVAPLSAWDVTVHSRDGQTWQQLEPMTADHGATCAGPPATHALTGVYADSVFQCANHIMTAIKAGGYGVIYMTPPVVADWADTPAVIQWDMSTLRTSARDWVDLWVTPYDEHLQLPLDNWLPDLNGAPRHAMRIKMDNGGNGSIFQVLPVTDFVTALLPGNWWTSYESFLTGGASASRRDTFQLTLSRTHVRFGMPAYNFWWVDTDITDLGWTSGVVQFGHHSYNPQKDCADTPQFVCLPDTWHWDNVSVTPSAPFTITRATQPYVDPSTSSTVTFPVPAEAGSHLRFAGVGQTFDYSLDSGATWLPMGLQPAERDNPDKARNWWQAIPAGTQAVDVRGTGGWWGSWIARDISLWSQVAVPPSQRTPTPNIPVPNTPTRTRTPTPPPSVTPGPTATDLPTPTSLPTLTPTSVTVPTVTPTSPPRCGRWDVINGGAVFMPYPDVQCMQ